MPKAAKHPCPHPGCGVLVDYGTRHYPVHVEESSGLVSAGSPVM